MITVSLLAIITFTSTIYSRVFIIRNPSPSIRQYLKMMDFQNCPVLYCALQLCAMHAHNL